MSEVVAFVLGAIFGGCVGLLMCALCVVSKPILSHETNVSLTNDLIKRCSKPLTEEKLMQAKLDAAKNELKDKYNIEV